MMDALTALQTRNSASSLTDPAPDAAQRAQLFRAALRAPDHARLRPWRFVTVEGEARQRLGAEFERIALQSNPDLDEAARLKLRNAPLRAPLLVIVLARLQPSPKVPEIEQLLAAGAAAQNLLVAAHALGFGGIWRTGDIAYRPELVAALGCPDDHRVVGILYLGTLLGTPKPLLELDPADYVRAWP